MPRLPRVWDRAARQGAGPRRGRMVPAPKAPEPTAAGEPGTGSSTPDDTEAKRQRLQSLREQLMGAFAGVLTPEDQAKQLAGIDAALRALPAPPPPEPPTPHTRYLRAQRQAEKVKKAAARSEAALAEADQRVKDAEKARAEAQEALDKDQASLAEAEEELKEARRAMATEDNQAEDALGAPSMQELRTVGEAVGQIDTLLQQTVDPAFASHSVKLYQTYCEEQVKAGATPMEHTPWLLNHVHAHMSQHTAAVRESLPKLSGESRSKRVRWALAAEAARGGSGDAGPLAAASAMPGAPSPSEGGELAGGPSAWSGAFVEEAQDDDLKGGPDK